MTDTEEKSEEGRYTSEDLDYSLTGPGLISCPACDNDWLRLDLIVRFGSDKCSACGNEFTMELVRR